MRHVKTMYSTKRYGKSLFAEIALRLMLAVVLIAIGVTDSFARDIRYQGSEELVHVTPGEPTQILFPSNINGGYFGSESQLSLQKEKNFVVILARPGLAPTGEVVIINLDDERSYSLRIVPAGLEQPRDDAVTIIDEREPEIRTSPTSTNTREDFPFAPPSAVAGFMREMILVAEFGKQKGITGYRRSNRYSGEQIYQDGALEATVDEIFMGTDLWGYVVTVNNLMDTSQTINPATFRMDGTRAISIQRDTLAPRPQTAEQKIANAHQSKVYIITRAKRR